VPFLLLLFSAERFNDRAIFFGSFDLNTPDSRSNASLVCITRRDHFFLGAAFFFVADFFEAVVRDDFFFFFTVVAIQHIYYTAAT
jgi:hypothetical protein